MPTGVKPRQQQHVEAHRKINLRKRLLTQAMPGAVYVPFCGDGDIALACYADRKIFACDIDPKRVATAKERLSIAVIVCADCDEYPFAHIKETIAIADFDAYANPYKAFVAWHAKTKLAKRVVIFFTDGERQSIKRHKKTITLPDCALSVGNWRLQFNTYPRGTMLPFIARIIAPKVITMTQHYLRGASGMVYMGVVAE